MENLKFLYLEHWAVLYSPSQRAFHYEKIKDCMFKHWEAMLNNNGDIDYVLLGVVEHQADAVEAIQYFKELWTEANDTGWEHSVN